jgi:hypothetical protein
VWLSSLRVFAKTGYRWHLFLAQQVPGKIGNLANHKKFVLGELACLEHFGGFIPAKSRRDVCSGTPGGSEARSRELA